MAKKLLKECACCGTRVQSNIVLKWKRRSDGKVFHICALCAELGEVSDTTVYETTNHDDYTTYVKEVLPHLLDDILYPVLKKKVIKLESNHNQVEGELRCEIDGLGYCIKITRDPAFDKEVK